MATTTTITNERQQTALHEQNLKVIIAGSRARRVVVNFSISKSTKGGIRDFPNVGCRPTTRY